ncbi:MAG: hypothetical protein NTW30_06150 [Candidatus Aenigmarchaeota archaeon]|nr:hypothetical protein [Candidatus Aenigmarchaeota archaeon]
MTYCVRCQGIILLDMPTEFVAGKEYHQVCALKETYRRIPMETPKETLLCAKCNGIFSKFMYVEYLDGKPYHYACASLVLHQLKETK